jgi:hypothetical protein
MIRAKRLLSQRLLQKTERDAFKTLPDRRLPHQDVQSQQTLSLVVACVVD